VALPSIADCRASRTAEHRGLPSIADCRDWLNSADISPPGALRGVHPALAGAGPSELGVLRQHYQTDDPGASLLLLQLMDTCPLATSACARPSWPSPTSWPKRPGASYRVGGTDTGFAGEEGSFTICSFWLVSALAVIGETDRAHALCQKLLSFGGPLLLYAEEIDGATGEHLGSFPQAFTHLALIEGCRCSSRPSRRMMRALAASTAGTNLGSPAPTGPAN
jgi:hypothetical protein